MKSTSSVKTTTFVSAILIACSAFAACSSDDPACAPIPCPSPSHFDANACTCVSNGGAGGAAGEHS